MEHWFCGLGLNLFSVWTHSPYLNVEVARFVAVYRYHSADPNLLID